MVERSKRPTMRPRASGTASGIIADGASGVVLGLVLIAVAASPESTRSPFFPQDPRYTLLAYAVFGGCVGLAMSWTWPRPAFGVAAAACLAVAGIVDRPLGDAATLAAGVLVAGVWSAGRIGSQVGTEIQARDSRRATDVDGLRLSAVGAIVATSGLIALLLASTAVREAVPSTIWSAVGPFTHLLLGVAVGLIVVVGRRRALVVAIPGLVCVALLVHAMPGWVELPMQRAQGHLLAALTGVLGVGGMLRARPYLRQRSHVGELRAP